MQKEPARQNVPVYGLIRDVEAAICPPRPGKNSFAFPLALQRSSGRFQIISHAMASLCEPRSLP